MADPPAYIRNLRDFTRGTITPDDLPRLEAEIYGTNDRASAVMLGAIVENAVGALIKSLMRPDINADVRHALFDHNGPLGTFSSKTATAYAFGGIGPVTRHDVDLIRELRNEFAHSRKSFGFEQEEVAAVCAKLQLPNHTEVMFLKNF
jgi:DNA-binding MltR family transcriptional regulator